MQVFFLPIAANEVEIEAIVDKNNLNLLIVIRKFIADVSMISKSH